MAGELASIDVRPSTPKDFDGFYECLAAICRERRYLSMTEPPPKDAARSFIEEARRRGKLQCVALSGPVVVGWCDITPHAFEGFRHCGRLGMGIAAGFRGRGIGRRLLEATVHRAREAGLTRVELEVFSSNVSAIRLYERSGFEHDGVHRHGRIIDGRVEDVLLMGRLFS
jgi:RimJ/RimL family protein N-acetyltransferase